MTKPVHAPRATKSPTTPARWRFIGLGALIFALTFVAFWPALRGQFIWDDLLLVDQNPLVTGDLSLSSVWFRTDFPLTLSAFYVQSLIWGHNPIGYHILNALLHGTSAVLLWRLLRRLGICGCWFAAAIFAVHPVCVASVAWISELKNTLSLPFFLLSLWAFLKSQEHANGSFNPINSINSINSKPKSFVIRHAFIWYILSLLAFILSLLAKTSTVMLPAVLLGLLWWQRRRLTLGDFLLTAPFFLLALAFGLMTIWFQAHGAIAGSPVQTEDWRGRLAGAGFALWFYLGKALLPLRLCMIYPRWTINAASPLSWVPLLLWCILLAVCWRFRRTWGRHALFGLGSFTILLLPFLGFFDMYFLALSRVSDHFEYVALIPVLTLVVGGLSDLAQRIRSRQPSLQPSTFNLQPFHCVGAVLVLALTVLAFQRAKVFANEEALWRDTLAKNPNAWLAHNNLGLVLAEQQDYDQAIEQFRASLELNPRNAQAHCNLANALTLQNHFAEAEGHYRDALDIKPNDPDFHRTYAEALAGAGRTAEALNQLRAAVQLRPDAPTRLEYAEMLYQFGHPREAVIQFRQVLRLQPDQTEALNNLAWLLATSSDPSLRDGPEAVRLAQRTCQLTSDKEPRMLGTLAAAYAEAGRFPEAIATAEKAIRLAQAQGDNRFVGTYQQLLALYRAGKPHHEPPVPSPGSGG